MGTELQVVQEREMTLDLARELADLLVQVVEDGASVGFLPPLSAEAAERYWLGALEDGVTLFTARICGRLAGTVQLQRALKANGSHRAEIAKLMVSPDRRRAGAAKALMNAAELLAQSEGLSLLVLDTREGDPSNLLYRSLGYTEAGRIPGYARSANGELHGTVYYYKELV
ncbi:GNAT family N-acetyltransferase [Paenibacillus pasadenensis]|uniref:GNAT family N-acetyltransferase n=1 Tax=Paenibacillus pasadenensis TaxID=217090 RepID=UPI00203ABAA8|nr:GNAT family N-acetyltransferase [Paenibacillus pasadenensis]MCM3746380.1 GNAT family N-acetyltransferase [Paenibacillus pasadenensis]